MMALCLYLILFLFIRTNKNRRVIGMSHFMASFLTKRMSINPQLPNGWLIFLFPLPNHMHLSLYHLHCTRRHFTYLLKLFRNSREQGLLVFLTHGSPDFLGMVYFLWPDLFIHWEQNLILEENEIM